MHLRAARAHGCTAEELREVCMQITCYCGFPTAADALRMLADIVVLSRDIFAASDAELARTTVAVTIFDGRVVYRRDARTTN